MRTSQSHCRSPVVPVGGGGGAGYSKTHRFDVKGISGNGNSGRLFGRNCISSGFLFGLLTVFLLVFATQSAVVEAKRGCANFGHSCYGGMGKRANALNGLNDEYTGQEVNVDQEENPALVFTGPRSEFRPVPTHRFLQLQRQQWAGGNVAANEPHAAADGIAGIGMQHSNDMKMSPYLRQLLRFYRNMQNMQNQRDDPDEK